MIFIILVMLCILAASLWFLYQSAEKTRLLQSELETARRKDSMGTLAGGIAHDFNNILASILGFGVLLEEDLTTEPDMQEMARQITTAARRGQNIVAQLMNYSRKTVSSDKDIFLPLSLDAVITESITLLQPCIRRSTNIRYSNKSGSDIVMGNATQLGQTILNLCINADHAIGVKAGDIRIEIDNVNLSKPLGSDTLQVSNGSNGQEVKVVNGRLPAGHYARISVTDNGDGMDKNVAARVFEPFFTTKAVGTGTGLGLAAIQGIIHSHNGGISLTTQKFKGTTFEIMLPLDNIPA